MRRVVAAAVVLGGVSLAGCGATDSAPPGAAATQPAQGATAAATPAQGATQPATAPARTAPAPAAARRQPATSAPAKATRPKAARAPGIARARSPSGRPVAPCGLLTRSDASRAFGAAARRPATQATSCTYRAAGRSVILTVMPGRDPRRPLAAGQQRVAGAGYTGFARSNFAGDRTKGAQAQVVIFKRATIIQVLLTDATKKRGTLLAPATRLGRAAAQRL